jgi:outer membrane protein OmpA-like peptidoglycan-associated protein
VRLAAAVLALACGCGGSALKAQAGAIGEVIANARENGAERCAPVELAMAESHHDFALQELSEGNYFQARSELRVAEDNANRALSKSPRQRCNPGTRVATPTDSDGDGILDEVDRCPEDPEDFDEFEDEDGCPDPDNDKDGIPDVDDKCPDTPANTKDGCPEYKLVKVTDKKIELRQTVYFDTARASIKRVSYPLLNEVAQVLKDNPKIEVRIEGHTDSRGKDAYNLRLSDDRAASVRRYLIQRGIDESRMVSKGYGERVPIADNRTKAGRGQNRRVEFVITGR